MRRRSLLDGGLDPVGDLPGRELRRLRYLHRDRARPVTLAAFRIAGLERDTVRRLGKPGRTQRVPQAVAELLTNHEVGSGDAQRVTVPAIVLPAASRHPSSCRRRLGTLALSALVAQGIEQWPPEPCAQVRILPRALACDADGVVRVGR